MDTYNFYVVNKTDRAEKVFLGSRPSHRASRFLEALVDRFNEDYEIVVEKEEQK